MDVAGEGIAKSVAEHPISIAFDILFPTAELETQSTFKARSRL
jgi:hypothetical protein